MTAPAYWPGIAAPNPVPGDPDDLRRLTEGLREVATNLTRVASRIESSHEALDAMTWDGPAATAYRRSQQRLPHGLRSTAAAYARVAEVLHDYVYSGNGLAGAQNQAWEAELRAQRARAAHDLCVDQARMLSVSAQNASAPGASGGVDQWQRVVALAHRDAETMHVIADAQQRCRELRDGVRARGVAAAAAIDAAGPVMAPTHHGSWLRRTALAALRHISKVASVISTVTALLAIMTIWCPALSGPLATISVITGAVALLCDAALSLTPGGPSKRHVAGEALLVGMGGAAKGARILVDAGKVQAGGHVLRDGQHVIVGRSLSRSYVPTLDRGFGRAGIAPRVKVRTYPSKAVPRQTVARTARQVFGTAASELPILVRPGVIRRTALDDLARVRQTRSPELHIYPSAHYRTWAVTDTVASSASIGQAATSVPAPHWHRGR